MFADGVMGLSEDLELIDIPCILRSRRSAEAVADRCSAVITGLFVYDFAGLMGSLVPRPEELAVLRLGRVGGGGGIGLRELIGSLSRQASAYLALQALL